MVAFLLGIVGTRQSGKASNASIAAIVVSVLGAVVSAGIVFFTVSQLFVAWPVPARAMRRAEATAEVGTLATACSQIDAVMEANPDDDAAGTAQQLEDIKVQVTTPDADLIGALASAYQAVADNPDVLADAAEGQQMATTLSESAMALGAACQSAITAPVPN